MCGRVYIQGDCDYILVRTKQRTSTQGSFAVTVKNVPCGESGVTCTKAAHVTTATVRMRLVLGAPPSINDVAVAAGRTAFPGGEIEVNDMFQYIKLSAGVEILFDKGAAHRPTLVARIGLIYSSLFTRR